ncbi:hypothetical protein BD626DRAFT_408073 [Schizophyllum amplum]|uniref:Uncharacterized protein n=1 Tax=Schizophyllum amplum TaxID=97359 RepID=A0A550C5G6_9AGAR|nr:hypothetical protein BD626DRAFT_408073 [Auriculariopsis ampla]
MSAILNKLRKEERQCTVAVIQYERNDFSVGHEEQFHWALVAVVSKKDLSIRSVAWQVSDRHYSDGRPMEWILHDNEVEVNKTFKCLGGVILGQISEKDVDKARKLVRELQQPKPKFQGWNCRDWVMEVIQNIFIPNGWAAAGATSQRSLLPSLRSASRASKSASQYHKRPMPQLVAFDP